MSAQSFPSLVQQQFKFLVSDYSFATNEQLYGTEPFSGGKIEFRSLTTSVVIVLDQGEVWARIGPTEEPEIGQLSLTRIVEYFSQGKDQSLLLHDYKPVLELPDFVKWRLSLIASALLRYCDAFLRGDFSDWLMIQKWFLNEMRTHYRAMTGKELPEDEQFTSYLRSKEKSFPH